MRDKDHEYDNLLKAFNAGTIDDDDLALLAFEYEYEPAMTAAMAKIIEYGK